MIDHEALYILKTMGDMVLCITGNYRTSIYQKQRFQALIYLSRFQWLDHASFISTSHIHSTQNPWPSNTYFRPSSFCHWILFADTPQNICHSLFQVQFYFVLNLSSHCNKYKDQHPNLESSLLKDCFDSYPWQELWYLYYQAWRQW